MPMVMPAFVCVVDDHAVRHLDYEPHRPRPLRRQWVAVRARVRFAVSAWLYRRHDNVRAVVGDLTPLLLGCVLGLFGLFLLLLLVQSKHNGTGCGGDH